MVRRFLLSFLHPRDSFRTPQRRVLGTHPSFLAGLRFVCRSPPLARLGTELSRDHTSSSQPARTSPRRTAHPSFQILGGGCYLMLVRPRGASGRCFAWGRGGAGKAAAGVGVWPPPWPSAGALSRRPSAAPGRLSFPGSAAAAAPQSPPSCQRPARAPLPEPLGGFLQPSLPRPQYVTWVTMAQVRASPSSARPGWSDPGKHKYKPIAKLRTMSEM